MGRVKAQLIEEMEGNDSWENEIGDMEEYQVHLPKSVKEKDFWSSLDREEEGDPEELDF